MRRFLILPLFLLAGCTEASEPPLAGWTTDYENAVINSKRSQRPLLLDFGATWCGPCKKLDATTLKDKDVAYTVQNGFIAVKIDVDRNRELTDKYQVKGFPTMIIVAPDGREIARRSGFIEAAPFLQWIKPHRSRNTAEVKAAQPASLASHDDGAAPRCMVMVKTSPNDFDHATKEAEARLAERYRILATRSADAGKVEEAQTYRRRAEELSAPE